MAADQALAALGRVRSIDGPQIMIAPIDWATFQPVYEAKRRRPLLDRIGARDERARTAPASNGLRQQFELASVEDRWVLLSAHIRAAAASVLGLGVDQIDLRRGDRKSTRLNSS